ncbi:MAG: hypothetical protein ACOH1H_08795 [Brevundimonas sp.]
MTKKKTPETDPDQSERFRKAVRDLEAAGELSPTDKEQFEKALDQIKMTKPD